MVSVKGGTKLPTVPAPRGRVAALPTQTLELLRRRGEVVALAGMLAITLFFPKALPPLGVYANGIVSGSTLALQAIGLVLVYRANRIVNFAQVQLGTVAGVLIGELAAHRQFVAWLAAACGSCVPVTQRRVAIPPGIDPTELSSAQIQALVAPAWMGHVNYVLSLAVALLAVYLVTMALYHLVVKRFSAAPRLVLTLVTIAAGEVLGGGGAEIHKLWGENEGATRAALPVSIRFSIGRSAFEAPDVMKVVLAIAAVIGIGLYLKRSVVGTALRGVADNPSRAETLGVPVRGITARVWVIAAMLSAAVSILDTAAIGQTSGGAATGIVRVLAPAVFAGFVSLPITIAAAIAIAVFDQSILWSYNSALLTEGCLLVVIVVVLLLLRSRRSRVDTDRSSLASSHELRPIPTELRSLPSVQRWIRIGSVSGIVLALGMPWLLSPSQTNQVSVDLIMAIVALSLLVLTGWAGQISLGQFGFAAVGAWTAAVLHLPFPFGIIAGAFAGAGVAVVLGIPALRLPGLYLAITTVAFAVAVPAVLLNPHYLAQLLPSTVKRPSLLGLDLTDERSLYYVVLAFLVLTTVAIFGMRQSRTARALIAARDNEAAAQSFGIDIVRARLAAFAISGFIAAMAGVLFSWATFGVDGAAFGAAASARVFLIAVLGGLGSISGPLMGAGYLAVVGAVLPALELQLAVGVTVIVALLFSPGGIGAAVFQLRDSVLRRIAERQGIAVPSLLADEMIELIDGRAPISPKQVGGHNVFIPRRYRLTGSWVVPAPAVTEAAVTEVAVTEDGRGLEEATRG